MKKLILLCAVALSFFTSCETENSEDVTQNRIFTSYEILYLQDEDKTVAKATFTFGNASGTRLELSEGASVTFNDKKIPFNSLLGNYELEMSGLVESGTFTYTDIEGNTFTNEFAIKPIAFVENVPTTIERSKSYDIDWIGDPVGSGESSVVVTVVPNNLGQTKIFIEADENAETVVLNPTVLSEIDPQPGRLYIERKDVSTEMESTSAGGVFYGNYRATSVPITIE
ncbi:hypothetical protein HX109_01415 [Galbibacter sp. BG1]|uniref:hypothetical protein n=1 Tax=Galbibacter sp. BG1 TaxID=1170699 RepID=UPI0015BB91DC|nr:hypothetical protein [Galbibacter sp. BG1]QLE00288.1 hypothetical protein HX109_01415 [Galbibacter sp. BG1]